MKVVLVKPWKSNNDPYISIVLTFRRLYTFETGVFLHEPSMPLVCWDLCPYNFHFITLWTFSPHEPTRLDILPLLLQGFLQRFRSGSCGHRWNSYSPSWSDAKKNPLVIPLLVKFPVNDHCRMISSWIAFQLSIQHSPWFSVHFLRGWSFHLGGCWRPDLDMSDFAKAAWCGQSSLEHIGTKVTKAKLEKTPWHPRLWLWDVSPLINCFVCACHGLWLLLCRTTYTYLQNENIITWNIWHSYV